MATEKKQYSNQIKSICWNFRWHFEKFQPLNRGFFGIMPFKSKTIISFLHNKSNNKPTRTTKIFIIKLCTVVNICLCGNNTIYYIIFTNAFVVIVCAINIIWIFFFYLKGFHRHAKPFIFPEQNERTIDHGHFHR